MTLSVKDDELVIQTFFTKIVVMPNHNSERFLLDSTLSQYTNEIKNQFQYSQWDHFSIWEES